MMAGEQYTPGKTCVPPRLVGGPLCQQLGHSSGAFLKSLSRWHVEEEVHTDNLKVRPGSRQKDIQRQECLMAHGSAGPFGYATS
jgi:hypothetical protein